MRAMLADAVLRTPHDLAARRAYVASKGCEPARRRIVEIEDTLAGKPNKRADRLALADERETLLARNGFAWDPQFAGVVHAEPVRGYSAVELEFELGFLSHVSMRASVRELGALTETSCYSLAMTLVEAEHFEALLASPLLPRLRRLSLHFAFDFDPERVLALLRSPKLGSLEQLGLDNLVITPALAEAIASQTELRSLSLGARPGTGSLAGTAAAPLCTLKQLRSLSLSGQDLDGKLLGKLLDASFVPQLERLAIRHHKLGARGCKLLGSANFGALRELDLSDSNVGAGGVEFAAAPKLATLERLVLDGSKLGAKLLPAFLAKLDLPKLRALRLGGLRFKEAGAEAIAASDAFERCGIVELSLGGNAMGDDGAEALAGAEGLAKIRRLNLGHNGIRADGILALADSPLLRGLELLDIRNNKIQTKGAIALAGSVAAKTLRVIDIDHNWIGSKGAAALFGSEGLRALEVARFGYDNNFEDAGLDALAESDLRLRGLLVNGQGGPEGLRRFFTSPAVERLVWLQAWSRADDELVDALAAGNLAPQLHTLQLGTMGVSAARVDALSRRFAYSVQRGNRKLDELE